MGGGLLALQCAESGKGIFMNGEICVVTVKTSGKELNFAPQ